MKKRFHWRRRFNTLDISVQAVPKLLRETGRKTGCQENYDSLSLKEVVMECEKLIERITKKAINGQEINSDTRELLKLVSHFIRYITRSSTLTGILEWLVKYGNESIRDSIVTQLGLDLECMARSKHCVGCVISLMENSNQNIRDKIISSFLGNILRLINHPVSSKVIDLAYTQYAGSTMKILMKQELYGPTFKRMRDELIDDLNQAVGRFPSQRREILRITDFNLRQIIVVGRGVAYSIFHDVLFDYLRETGSHDKNEMINSITNISPLVFLNSKEGSYVLLAVMESENTEAKQAILECVLPHLIHLASNAESYLFTIAISFALNRFKAYHKVIANIICEQSSKLAQEKFGSCFLLYVLAPCEKYYLQEHRNETLNDLVIQQKITEYGCQWEKALLKTVRDVILVHIVQRVSLWITNEYSQKVTKIALRYAAGPPLECAFQAISHYLIDCIGSNNNSVPQSTQEFISSLIEEDLGRDDDDFTFSYVFVTSLSLKNMIQMKNSIEGTFIMRQIIQSSTKDLTEVIRSIIETGKVVSYSIRNPSLS